MPSPWLRLYEQQSARKARQSSTCFRLLYHTERGLFYNSVWACEQSLFLFRIFSLILTSTSIWNRARAASVPIAVCLDHATDPEHLELVLGLAEKDHIIIDTVMVDSSHADVCRLFRSSPYMMRFWYKHKTDEENIALSRPYVERCTNCGISVEVELGRLEGGEAGLRMISDAKLTNPDKAEHFMAQTGAIILAPSIGNIHGRYTAPPDFRQDMYVLSSLSNYISRFFLLFLT